MLTQSRRFKYFKFLLWSISILFILSYLQTISSVFFNSDDIFYYLKSRKYGAFSALSHIEFNNRYSSFFLFNFLFGNCKNIDDIHFMIRLYYIFLLVLFITVNYLFIRAASSKFLINVTFSFYDKLLLSILLIFPFYCFNSQPSEIWFWTIASMVYLLPVCFSIMGFSLLLDAQQNWYNSFLIVLSFIYIGGALETYAILCCVFLLLIFVFYKKQRIQTAFALMAIAIPLTFNILSSGTGNRFQLESVQIMPKIDLFGIFFSYRFFIGFTFLILVFFSAHRFKNHINANTIKLNGLIGIVTINIIAGLIAILPVLILFKGTIPERTLLPVTTVAGISAIILTMQLGVIVKPLKIDSNLLCVIAGLIMILQSIHFYKHQSISKAYIEAYHKRINYLQDLKQIGNRKVIYLKPLPDSGTTVYTEITTDTSHWSTQHFKSMLLLNFEVAIK